MGADEYVYFAFFHPFVDFVFLSGGSETVQVVNVYGKSLKAFAEGVVVLKGEDGVWNKHCHLFRVTACLEGGADGDFSFAETDIAAHQAVHRG